MLLTTTSATYQVFLGAAVTTNEWTVVTTWSDNTTTTYTPSITATTTNGVTPVTAVGSPASSTQRVIRDMHILNKDSVSGTVTVRYNDGSSTFRLVSFTLNPHDTLIWTVRRGWHVLDAAGIQRVTSGGAVNSPDIKVLPANSGAVQVGTFTLVSGTTYAKYLGRTAGPTSKVVVRINLLTAGTSITWAESAIAQGVPVLNGNASLSLQGSVVDMSQVINTIGNKKIVLDVNAPAGVDMWWLFGCSFSGTAPVHTNATEDAIQIGFSASASVRPSTMSNPSTFTIDGATSDSFWTTWTVIN